MPIPVLLPPAPAWNTTSVTSGFTADARHVQQGSWLSRGSGAEMLAYPRIDNVGDGLPHYFMAPYRLVISWFDGQHAAEVADASMGSLQKVLNGKTDSFSFSVPITSDAVWQINEPFTEWRVFRGRKLIHGGVITKRRTTNDGKQVEFTCEGLRFYFDRRYLNRMPRREFVENRSFASGMAGWRLGRDPRNATNVPSYSIVTDPVYSMDNSDKRALKLVQSEANHDSFAYQHFAWSVDVDHKDGDEFVLTAWVYVPSDTYNGPAYGERGLMLELFSAFDETGQMDDRENRSLKSAIVPINDDTPKDKWTEMRATLLVPYDDAPQYVSFRLYPPRGTAVWDEVSLTVNERLVYRKAEQTVILADIINLSQDEDHGKTDLLINPFFAKTSKVRRNKTYLYSNDQKINEVIDEAVNMERGVDVEIIPTAEVGGQRWFVQHYPHKGQYKKNFALVLGKNITKFDVQTDGASVANSIMVRAADTESTAVSYRSGPNTTLADGLVLERVLGATPGSSITSLDDQATRGLKRYRQRVNMVTVTAVDPATGAELWDYLDVGDTTDLIIQVGQYDINGIFRVMSKTLDPNTREVTFSLVPKEYAYDANA